MAPPARDPRQGMVHAAVARRGPHRVEALSRPSDPDPKMDDRRYLNMHSSDPVLITSVLSFALVMLGPVLGGSKGIHRSGH